MFLCGISPSSGKAPITLLSNPDERERESTEVGLRACDAAQGAEGG